MLRHLAVVALMLSFAGCSRTSAVKTHPEGIEGLKSLVTDVDAAAKAGDKDAAAKTIDALVFSNAQAEAFFGKHYDDATRPRLIAEYVGTKPSGVAFVSMLEAQRAKGRTEVLVEKFTAEDDDNAVGFQSFALRAQKTPVALYSVRFLPPGKTTGGQHLYNFVYEDGAWHFAGPMKSANSEMDADPKMDAVSGLRARDRKIYFESGKLPGDP